MTAPTPTPGAETREALSRRDRLKLRNAIGCVPVGEDNLAIVLVSEFERQPDCPEDGEKDDSGCWEQWAVDRTNEVLDAAADAILSSGLVMPAAEVEETKRLLSDPNAIHINMLAGKIAKPSVEQIVHTYAGEVVPAHTVSDLAVMHMERDQAIADLAERDAQIARLREALQLMVDHDVDYMTINHLGDPEVQHRIIRARAALTVETKP